MNTFASKFARNLAWGAVAFVVLSVRLHAAWWVPCDFTVCAVALASASAVLRRPPKPSVEPADATEFEDARPGGQA